VPYTPHTDEEREEMLRAIGVESVDDLFDQIPENLRIARLNLPSGMSELEVARHVRSLAARNANLDDYISFLGAGAYDHFIPSVVRVLTSRGEFSTAYTPYQPEVSQGTLQAVYEYQTLICALTGMDIANASMYDGASALAEAAILCLHATRRNEVVIARSVHPEYRATVATYLRGADVRIREVDYDDDTGTTRLDALESNVCDKTAAVVVQHPNFFGALEPVDEIRRLAHGAGALYVACVNPVSLGVLRPPGEYGADVVVGEGQPLGNPLAFGGPYLGFFAVTSALMRRVPGRLSGETQDTDGRRACVLTLRAREQDIRREKATSNICTNQALNALAACVHLSALGRRGFSELAELNLQKAHYAHRVLTALPGVAGRFSAPFFNEFVLRLPRDVEATNQRLLQRRIIGGLPLRRFYPNLGDCCLFAVTETRTRADIHALEEALHPM
jgi:glycine dehydrogenase subunit 1